MSVMGGSMILLTRLNQDPFYLNQDLIEHLEATPDTVITLNSGHRYLVRESAEEVVARVVDYRRGLIQPLDSRAACLETRLETARLEK